MVKPNFELTKKRFDLLHAFLLQLQDLARLQQWDDFEFAWPEYEKLTIDLPAIDWIDFNGQERAILQQQLQQIKSLHAGLELAAIAWQSELQSMMKGLLLTNRLSDKYL